MYTKDLIQTTRPRAMYDNEIHTSEKSRYLNQSDQNVEKIMKEPRSNLVSGVVSLVETINSVKLIGISEIDFENDFHKNLTKTMDSKGSNFSMVFTTKWDFQKQETSLWKGFVSMTVSMESYSFKELSLIHI